MKGPGPNHDEAGHASAHFSTPMPVIMQASALAWLTVAKGMAKAEPRIIDATINFFMSVFLLNNQVNPL